MAQKVVAIVQARMGSTRLPAKVMAEIAGRPILWHVVNRLEHAKNIDLIVVATSVKSGDDPIISFCEKNGLECFRGSESDVLDRFYRAATTYKADAIVRCTSDCPLIDAEVTDRIIDIYLKGGYDYVTNTLRYTYPDGLDIEVFSYPALEAAWREARAPAEREHVTTYIRNSGKFRLRNVENREDLSQRDLRWTVDEQADLDFVREVYNSLWSKQRPYFGMVEILKLIDERPELSEINRGITRNEGFYKSLISEEAVKPRVRHLKTSYDLKERAEKVIPSCSQTFSKGPTQFIQGIAPVFLERGEGSHVWDVDGNEYIDYPLGLGPIILGHNYPAVTKAVLRQLRKGVSFSMPHPLEIEVSELLTKIIPCAEMVRFGKNGVDATSGAVRVARAFTGRDVIACCGYHGWHDWYIVTTTRSRGVPDALRPLTATFEYNNIGSLESVFEENRGKVAAVIMEPMGVMLPKDNFLKKVRDLTSEEGALLIFDEIVTGFRISMGGAQEYFKVTPDLACFGKAMANGYPVSAVVGRRDVMKLFDEVFFSFTFGGETLSLAAAAATMNELREKNALGHIWEQGRRFQDGYNTLAKLYGISKFTECTGLPPHTVTFFRDETGGESLVAKSLFQQECLKRGILFSGTNNICFSHSAADIDYTLRVFRTAMEILADAIAKGDIERRLEGEPVKPVFRRP